MGELNDLIAIHGAVDREVVREDGRRGPVSQLLPVYSDGGEGWFDAFEAWIDEKRGDVGERSFPSVEEALSRLGETPASGHMRARRLFAVALAAQAFPELRLEADNERKALARGALRVDGLAGGDEEAGQLLELLGEGLTAPAEDGAPRALDEWWERVVAAAAERGLIDDPEGIGPRPCSGRLVMAPLPGGRIPATTLMTVWETDRIPFDHATSFLEPLHWPDCCAFWCSMKRLAGKAGAAHHSYHEVVSTNCPAWTIEADLDFSFTRFDGLAVTEYQLSEGHPQEGDDVLVDEGSLVVQRLGPDPAARLRVTTTKRIRFARNFGPEQLLLLMCALGYASVVKELVFSCAALRAEDEGTPFPGRAPSAIGLDPGSMMKDLADQAAIAVKVCIDEWADAAEASSKAMAEGRYGADALVQDATAMWARLVREGAAAVDLGARSARTAARTRGRPPPRERSPS